LKSLLKNTDMAVVEDRAVKTNKPVLLTGFQDTGLIGVTAIGHIINALRMEEVAYLKSRLIPTVKIIVGSEFRTLNPFRIYVTPSGDALALINDSPTGFMGLSPFFVDIGETLTEWFHKKDIRMVVALGSYLVQKTEKAGLVAYSTDTDMMKELTELDIKPLEQGFIGGLVVSIIDECIEKNIPWMMIFAPTSSVGGMDLEGVRMIIEGVNKILKLNIETDSLKRMPTPKKKGVLGSLRKR